MKIEKKLKCQKMHMVNIVLMMLIEQILFIQIINFAFLEVKQYGNNQ